MVSIHNRLFSGVFALVFSFVWLLRYKAFAFYANRITEVFLTKKKKKKIDKVNSEGVYDK